ncbi:MAG: hypothetical protein A2039_08075 [Candidatus Melainabacteria bacterium GWA2_34_9]|nr:MAG: hypothetical protein A2039_08075 [Candidatus Melainabacteria bacterium GWA2_34_9]
MKNNLLNHDRFNTWQTCRKKYYFKYIKELKYPEFHQDYELGKSVHALIDYHLRGLNIEHLLKNSDKEIVVDNEIYKRWNAIKNHPILDKKVIKTEWGFNTNLKGTSHWLIGRIDAIFFDEEKGKYIIADWKTGIIPKNININFQHQIYLYALYQSKKDLKLDFKPENLVFQYFKIIPDAVEITEITFSEEKSLEYEENFVKIINKIENTIQFPAQENCQVKICSYKSICKNN